ncbi:hypothetical protein HaLaN_04337 [Haematococcus lacustris]|uniref:Uncharacterized protein n=1 Tax=Haematococcus lacustris TaxID=44745 RepID=A0A699YGM3_HAELA|nr:hypothetical protein HaLaN_04337 [Haematococcus lacustris]
MEEGLPVLLLHGWGGAVLVPLKGAASARKQQQRLSEALVQQR